MADRGLTTPAARQESADDALTELYATHWVPLVRLAYLLVRDSARAEDVVQDAFVASYPRLARLREDGTALAYLRRAVVNGCRTGFRHRAVENRYLATASAAADLPGRGVGESAEASAVQHADDLALLEAVHALPARQREILVLRYYADLSELQIAQALGISSGSVKTHAHRAINTLRRVQGDLV